MALAAQKDIVIIGGGIIGCTTAYFLTRHPSYSSSCRITLLEASSSSDGGRTPDSIKDPATLFSPETETGVVPVQGTWKRNPAHDGIAGGASGKAGGLLALWAFPPNIVPLSFKLHERLAEEHDGPKRWGYRRCFASQVDCRARLPPALAGADASESAAEGKVGKKDDRDGAAGDGAASQGLHRDHKMDNRMLRKLGAPEDLDWVQTLRGYEGMGTPDDTAQVHPDLFTRSMAQLAEEAGVRIVTGARVTSIEKTADGCAVQGVTFVQNGSEERQTMHATDVVVAAGPWTSRLLPQIPVTSARAHSVVIKTPRPVSAYALFTSIALPTGFPAPTPTITRESGPRKERAALKRATAVEPEIYARPDGTVYACGPTDQAAKLPLTTAEVEVDEARCDDIAWQVGGISDELGREGEVVAKQACYLPQGGPFIGEVGGTTGLFVAAGHTCWGIQNAPASGKLIGELVLDGRAISAELGQCDPSSLS